MFSVAVAPGTPATTIYLEALTKITAQPDAAAAEASATRVLERYRAWYSEPVTIVLETRERTERQEYAEVAAAARMLTALPNAQIVVDSSPNSLDQSALTTKRQRIVYVELMSRDVLEDALEHDEGTPGVKAALAEAGVADVVWAVLGGNPADYKYLAAEIKTATLQATRVGQAVNVASAAYEFVGEMLRLAIKQRNDSVVSYGPILTHFASMPPGTFVPYDVVTANKVLLPSPDKVLRAVSAVRDTVLVPVTPAMDLVLRHSLKKVPTLEQLDVLVKADAVARATRTAADARGASDQDGPVAAAAQGDVERAVHHGGGAAA